METILGFLEGVGEQSLRRLLGQVEQSWDYQAPILEQGIPGERDGNSCRSEVVCK